MEIGVSSTFGSKALVATGSDVVGVRLRATSKQVQRIALMLSFGDDFGPFATRLPAVRVCTCSDAQSTVAVALHGGISTRWNGTLFRPHLDQMASL